MEKQMATVTIDGKEYEAAPLTRRLQADMAKWAKDRAWREIEQFRGQMDQALYEQRHAAATALVCSRFFDPGNEGFARAIQSNDGQMYLMFLLLSAKNPELKLEQVTAWAENLADQDFEAAMKKLEKETQEQPA
jgi:hypothetical protein